MSIDPLQQLRMSRPIRYVAEHPDGWAIVFPPKNEMLQRVVAKQFPKAYSVKNKPTADVHTGWYWVVPFEDGLATRLEAFAATERFEFTKAAQTILDRELVHALASRELASQVAPTKKIEVPDFRAPLRDYQLAALEFGEGRTRIYIADEMGLGKTRTMIAWVHAHDAYPCVVVVPANARTNWELEYKECLPDSVKVRILEGRPTEGDSLLDWIKTPGKRSVVASYSTLHDWLPHLRVVPWRSLLLDEAHYIRKYSARRTRDVIELAADVPRRGFMSGTPMEKGTADFRPQFVALGVVDLFDGYVSLTGRGSDADHLAFNLRLAETIMIRRKKAQVAAQLPRKDIQWISVDVDESPMLGEYMRAESAFNEWLEDHPDEGAELPMGTLRRLLGTAKVNVVIDWMKPLWNTAAVPIIFAYHHEAMDLISKELEGAGIGVIRYHGKMTKPQKDAAVTKFQAGEGRCMVAQIGAAGVALNLTRADTVIFTELDWLPTTHDQAMDRAHRLTSKHDRIDIRYLWAPKTLDEDLRTVLTTRAAQIGIVVDGQHFGPKATLRAFKERVKGERTRPERAAE